MNTVSLAFAVLVWVLCLAILFVTVAPMTRSDAWWVRMWDFPRLQILIAAAVVLILSLFAGWATAIPVTALMLLAGGYQFWRISPYTPLAAKELVLAPDSADQISLLSSNVLMENTDYRKLSDLIDRVDPDVILLMETDNAWVEAMEPVLKRYDTVIRHPRDNHYGMVFATRLSTENAEIVYLTPDETPSIFAELRTTEGVLFRFVGLHPRPPVPGQDTEERDAQVRYAARFARSSGVPLVTMGDFNDVAWSDSSQMFKHFGGYIDPRVGRGLYSSFDANKIYMRCPIDHFFVTEEVAVVSFHREAHIGSDHFPIVATIRLDEGLADRLNRPPKPLTDEEKATLEETLNRQRELLDHRDFSADPESN